MLRSAGLHHAIARLPVFMDMEVTEAVKELGDGVHYTFWTFGGEAPGPMIRVYEDDLVEFTPPKTSTATTCPTPSNCATRPAPVGEPTPPWCLRQIGLVQFRAIKPGLYVYHCATAPVGLHIANGMYGLILL